MRFTSTPLADAFLIGLERHEDTRGTFARAFCAQEFAEHGLETNYVQANISTNARAGTVRGLHFQREPLEEVKLVRCTKGAIYDVIVDMREKSQTYMRWFSAELSEENGLMMYVPKGFAHGYQTLSDGASLFYMMSTFYAPHAVGGLRFDDPKLAIEWPLPITDFSPRDAQLPLLDETLSRLAT